MILVTGGAGYIGSHTVEALLGAGHNPVIFDDFSTGHRDFVGTTPLVEGDVRRAADLDRAFESYSIDGVIHFAGRALVAESVEHPERYYETNFLGGLNLLNAMRRYDVQRIIFSSSCATYGIPRTDRLGEDHPQVPINPYGETKLAFERALVWFHQAHGIEYLSLRYFNAAGADPEGRHGEDHAPETHLIPLVLAAAAGTRGHVTIYGTDYPTADGTCIRDYVHVSDLATAHVRALEKLSDGEIESQSLNLGTGDGASVREVIDVVRSVTGQEFQVIEGDRRPGDPPRLVAAPDRAFSRLDWKPEHSSLGEIVETAWCWMARRHAR